MSSIRNDATFILTAADITVATVFSMLLFFNTKGLR